MPEEQTPDARPDVALATIAKEWGRIGCTGFGGPPTHIAMLRRLAVEREGWLGETEFEDAIAATNLLPGPASTQLAIFCAWRLRGLPGALVGGGCFICPGLALILGLAALFLASNPPTWVEGAALGTGAAVAAVALNAALGLLPASWRRAGTSARPPGSLGGLRVGGRRRGSDGRHLPRARPARVRRGGGRPVGRRATAEDPARRSSWHRWAWWQRGGSAH